MFDSEELEISALKIRSLSVISPDALDAKSKTECKTENCQSLITKGQLAVILLQIFHLPISFHV